MTFEVIRHLMKKLRLHNVSIHTIFVFYQYQCMNECAKRKKLNSRSVTSFFVRCKELTFLIIVIYTYCYLFSLVRLVKVAIPNKTFTLYNIGYKIFMNTIFA